MGLASVSRGGARRSNRIYGDCRQRSALAQLPLSLRIHEREFDASMRSLCPVGAYLPKPTSLPL